MVAIVKRPRRVARELLSEETQRQYLTADDLTKVDAVLENADELWTRKEFRFLMRCIEDIDESQS